ncbi:MAG: hypothetical protein LBJ00_17935 [Planctomycetaceae bacterium]|nr:hypothetical protein [Planctomycetaceae bacterium]
MTSTTTYRLRCNLIPIRDATLACSASGIFKQLEYNCVNLPISRVR